MCMTNLKKEQSGVTLIELIVSIVIISIALGGILLLFVGTMKTSADPMVRAQGLAIAQSYMDEIMMQAYLPVANPVVNATCSDGDPPEKSNRATYNDVEDYHNLSDTGAHDQNGCLIDLLAGYAVSVQVISSCTVALCGAQMNAVNAKKITVTVSHPPTNFSIPISAYRTGYL